jgi:hypothetical protein
LGSKRWQTGAQTCVCRCGGRGHGRCG